ATGRDTPCCCLCNGMGWLCGSAQVHPGRSGFETMDPSRIEVRLDLRTHPHSTFGFDAAHHMLVQLCAHVEIHVIAKRFDDVQCHLDRGRRRVTFDRMEREMLRPNSQHHVLSDLSAQHLLEVCGQ